MPLWFVCELKKLTKVYLPILFAFMAQVCMVRNMLENSKEVYQRLIAQLEMALASLS